MKYITIFLLLMPLCATAQWRWLGFGNPDATGGFGSAPLAFVAHDHHFYVSLPGEGVLRQDTPVNWVHADTDLPTGGGLTAFASLDTILFGSVVGIQGFQTTNDGSRWTRTGIGGPIATVGKYVLGYGIHAVYRSGDLGATWTPTSCPAPGSFATGGPYAFAITGSGMYRSADTGATWKTISPPENFSLKAFAVIGSNIFMGDTGLYLSTDSGSVWSEISLQNRVVNALATSDSFLFAGTDSGVYISSDLGASWRNVTDNVKARSGFKPNVTLLAVVDTLLYAAVEQGASNDVWRCITDRPIAEMTSNEAVALNPPASDTINLFPNPSMGMVTIYSGRTSILGVCVLNVLGEPVLSTEYRAPSDATLDLSKLPSGTYFIEIETDKGITLRKIVKE